MPQRWCMWAVTPVLREAIDWAAAEGLALVPLGEGSNVVLAGDIDALVLRMETRGIVTLEDKADTVLLRGGGR